MAKQVDVLLVNPGSPAAVYQELSNEYSAIEPPSLVGLFATYIRNKGYTVAILDAPAFNLSPEQAAQTIVNDYEAKLVVMVVYGFQPSASTQNMSAAEETCAGVKQRNPELKILITGTHPAALPKQTLASAQVDFVCSLEGPQTILGALQVILSGKDDFSEVPSLVYYDSNGEICSTKSEPLMQDLDAEMPGVAWDLLPMEKYRAHNWHCLENIEERKPYASLHTTLGCPYRCTFCCINAPFGKSSYRMWSPETVIKDIDILVNKYGVRNIKFVDEMFVLNKSHVMGLCDLIIERGYDLNIWAYARVDTVKDEFLDKMKRAGIRWLALGIESGSKHVRDGVEKGRFGTEEILEVVKKIKEAGINVIGNYIFGLPDDTFESMSETVQLAIEANCEFANFYCAMAYPGSQLYDMAIKNDWQLPKTWIGFSQHSYECLPLRTDVLSAAEVLKFRDEAFAQYFSNPTYLNLVKEKFGQAAYDHISSITKIKLRRKICEEADPALMQAAVDAAHSYEKLAQSVEA